MCRPLPRELLEYARTDVHYTLYLARCLQEELCAAGEAALSSNSRTLDPLAQHATRAARRSQAMTLSLYTKPAHEVSPRFQLDDGHRFPRWVRLYIFVACRAT